MNFFNNEINQILIIKMLDKNDENKNSIQNIFYWFLDRKTEKDNIINLIVNNFSNEEIINFPFKNYEEKIQILENKYKIQKMKTRKPKNIKFQKEIDIKSERLFNDSDFDIESDNEENFDYNPFDSYQQLIIIRDHRIKNGKNVDKINHYIKKYKI